MPVGLLQDDDDGGDDEDMVVVISHSCLKDEAQHAVLILTLGV